MPLTPALGAQLYDNVTASIDAKHRERGELEKKLADINKEIERAYAQRQTAMYVPPMCLCVHAVHVGGCAPCVFVYAYLCVCVNRTSAHAVYVCVSLVYVPPVCLCMSFFVCL